MHKSTEETSLTKTSGYGALLFDLNILISWIFQYSQYTKVQKKPHLQRHLDMEHAQTLVPTPLAEQRIEHYKYYKHDKKIISLRRRRILNQWTDTNKHMLSKNLVSCKRGPCFFLLWSVCLFSILLLSCQNDRISEKQNHLRRK